MSKQMQDIMKIHLNRLCAGQLDDAHYRPAYLVYHRPEGEQWRRYFPHEFSVPEETELNDSELSAHAERHGRTVCTVNARIALLVLKPDEHHDLLPQYHSASFLISAHQSIAVLPDECDTFNFIRVVNPSRKQDARVRRLLGADEDCVLYKLFQYSLPITGQKKVLKIFEIGEYEDGKAWEIALDWPHDPCDEIAKFIREFSECKIAQLVTKKKYAYDIRKLLHDLTARIAVDMLRKAV